MIKRKVLLVVLGISIIRLLAGQDLDLTKAILKVDTIPFILTEHNNIAIYAQLNGVDSIKLMFHTAANDISLIKESAKELKSLIWDEKVDGVKSWGGTGEQRTSKNNSLRIGDLEWNKLLIWENVHSGPTTDGKFGPNLFKDRPIEIDFESKHLVVHSNLPIHINNYEKIPIQFENGFMFIGAISIIKEVEVKNRYLIHSGYSGAVLLDDIFVEEHEISENIDITEEQELKDSFGNILKTKKGLLSKFVIGKYELQNLPVGFFEGSIGRQKMSVIGGNILKRFNIIIDSNRENLYVKSNGLSLLTYKNG